MRRQDGSFCHDPLGLEQLQPQSVPEHQVLWLRVLEAVDAGMSWPSKRRMQIQMAARLSERVQGILAQFDHREITLTLLGMHAALQLVSQGLQQMVLDREGRIHPESDEEEVEVPVDEAEHAALFQKTTTARMSRGKEQQGDAVAQMGGEAGHSALFQKTTTARKSRGREQQGDEVAMMQMGAVRADLEHFLRRQLELQPHPEATLLLLAQLGARPPDGCSNGSAESSDNEEISVGTLRPGLVRLLWTSPSNLVPTVLAEVLALPGKPHEDPGHAQRTARNLEQSIPTKEQSEAEKVLFQSWRDESDIGIVQEALKLLASVAHQPEPSGEPWVSSENRETQSAQQTWVELETILEAVPAETVQKVAAALAMTYNDVDSLGPPPSLLRLRIALRERSCEQAQEPVQEAETDQGQDQDDMRSWTKTEAAVVDDTVAGRRQEAETEPGPAGSRDLEEQQEQLQAEGTAQAPDMSSTRQGREDGLTVRKSPGCSVDKEDNRKRSKPEPGVNLDGARRDPDSYERGWLQEYTEAQAEEERMGDLLADLEEEALVEQARQEYDEEQMQGESDDHAEMTASDSS
ncbi:unnamed protein product [Symbiodinium pilosum]|uniref:Uncharacterized protein n=1 Tax=Symbiodinium pilosum TaxID=2952 RepID=A0A812M195_SYMPI|nr:unnamed protein product [Symbiodinium pilosum]